MNTAHLHALSRRCRVSWPTPTSDSVSRASTPTGDSRGRVLGRVRRPSHPTALRHQGFRAGISVYSRRYTRLLVTGKTLLWLGASSELPNSSNRVRSTKLEDPFASRVHFLSVLERLILAVRSKKNRFWSFAGTARGYRCPYIPHYAGICCGI